MRNAFIAGITSIAMVLVMVNIPIKYFSYNHWFNPNFGTSLTTISSSDQLSDFPTTYNANLAALNAGKIEISTTTLPLITTLANLTTTGTIGTGVWQGTTIDELYGGTGFSTYATGDLIYASGVNTLSKLTASSTGEVLTLVGGVPVWRDGTVNEANNFNWTGLHTFTNATSSLFSAYQAWFGGTATTTIDSAGNVTVAGTLTANGGVAGDIAATASSTTWTTSGTYTKSSGATLVYVRAWGGGGSGENDDGTAGSGGGGGGEYIEMWFEASDLGATETITIGAGGASVTSAGNGNNGGDTTFGSLLTANGGLGGTDSTNDGLGGAGGNTHGSLNTLWGAGGTTGTGGSGFYSGAGGGGVNATSQGNGGASTWGGAGGGGASSNGGGTGGASVNGGDGGAGAYNGNATAGSTPGGGGGANSGTGNSGAGGGGQIIVTEFF